PGNVHTSLKRLSDDSAGQLKYFASRHVMRRVGATELRGRQILRHSPERLQNSRYISSSAVILAYADAK
ncbi:Hypothetical predicted protein, partial [Paramuricea clavata]